MEMAVKDYFSGFFLRLENQIRQGQVVILGNHAGMVEEVKLRFLRLRDFDGNVHYVPGGTISSAIVIRARMQVAPLEQWTVRRQYLLRLKQAFDAQDVELALQQGVLNRPRRPSGQARQKEDQAS